MTDPASERDFVSTQLHRCRLGEDVDLGGVATTFASSKATVSGSTPMATTRGRRGFFNPTLAKTSGMTAVNASPAPLRYTLMSVRMPSQEDSRWQGVTHDGSVGHCMLGLSPAWRLGQAVY